MRTPNLGSVFFAPQDPSNIRNLEEMKRYVRDLELRTAAAINALAAGHLDPVHVEPEKPRLGDKRIADGTDWNPGSGFGEYTFNGTTWVLVAAL